MKLNDFYDVIVVGAGPAGCVAANYSTKYGARVLLLERSKSRLNPVRCAEGVFLNFLDPRLSIPLSSIANSIRSLSIHSPNGKHVIFKNVGKGVILKRDVFESYLLRKAVSKGVQYIQGASVKDLLVNNCIVKGIIVSHEGKVYNIGSSIVIAADGIESRIARLAGLDSSLSNIDLESGYQYRIRHPEIPSDVIQIHVGNYIAPGCYAWVFPKGDGTANVGLAVNSARGLNRSAKSYCHEFVFSLYKEAEILSEVGGGIPSATIMKKTCCDGLIVVGDAARLVNPLTGGGIDSALFSGLHAGLIVSEAIKIGDYSSSYLKQYDSIIKKRYAKTNMILHSLALRAKRMSDKRANDIVQLLASIPEDRRSIRSFIAYLLRKEPMAFLNISKSYILRK